MLLPAPLGPISPTTVPSRTVKLQSSTAVTPPKVFVSAFTSRIAALGHEVTSCSGSGELVRATGSGSSLRQPPPASPEAPRVSRNAVAVREETLRAVLQA